ncbi:MAG TPA: sugar phosphate isomerase/epimerase family protein [Rhizobiaceae bacterium]|nr:sugar phosphate isomerase/epimerase family protein [Rhizobiaceae bacterium]
MPANNSRPVLGAALTIGELERLHNWVMERDRDLELQEFGYAQVLEGDWRPLVDRYKQLLSGHQGRVGIHGPFWGFDIAPHDPDIREIVRKRLLQGLEVCEALGATHMVVHSPFTTWDYNNLDGAPGERDALFRRCHKTMADAVKRAENIGCELVIENIEDIDPRDRIALAQSFNSANVRISVDTGHAHYAHVSNGAPPVDYYIITAGKQLAHVHLQDADGHADRHWAPGEGTILWRSVFDAVARHCDNPRLILELNDKGKLVQAASYLEELGVAL